MNKRTRVTVADLPESTLPEMGGEGAGVFLYCRRCGAEYSASRGDYFWMRPGSVLSCEGGVLGDEHARSYLRLVRRVSRLVPA